MLAGQLILGAAIVAAGVVLAVAARGVGAKGRGWVIALIAMTLAGIVLVPASVRDWADWFPLAVFGVGMVFALLSEMSLDLLIGAFVCIVLGAFFTILLRWLIPGGFITLVLGMMGGIALVPAVMSVANARRARRAAALEPGKQAGRVGIGGAVVGDDAKVPMTPDLQAAWWTIEVIDGVRISSGALHIDTPLGPALIDVNGATFDFEMSHVTYEEFDDCLALLDKLGADDDAMKRARDSDASKEPGQATIHYLPAETEVYAVGRPEWEQALPRAGGYRDSQWVPVFRAAASPLHVVDRPSERARREAVIDAVAWFACAAACLSIIALQRLGLA